MKKGTIFNIQRFSVNDGPGIRTTVFFKGCPLRCSWCHNPESHRTAPQLLFFKKRCIRCGVCAEICPHGAIGKNNYNSTDAVKCTVCGYCTDFCAADARQIVGHEMTVDDVMLEIEKDSVFYQQSAGGVTFSGGEPMAQADFLATVLLECQKKGIHSAVDTCGYAPWSILQKTAERTDLFLYDLKIMDEARHIAFTGVSNKIILANLQQLARAGANIIVRVPIIPGITDDDNNLKQIAAFIARLAKPPEINLLPFHSISAKYDRLDKHDNFNESSHISATRLHELAKSFESAHIAVSVGG